MKERKFCFWRTAGCTWAWLVVATCNAPLAAADWPMWRGNSGRTGATTEALPKELHLQWTLRGVEPRPAWPEDPRLQFDASPEPIVAGGRLFVAGTRDDSMTAVDAASGELLWRFFAEAPIRFAPVAHEGALYFGADDGAIYSLDAATGSLRWRRVVHETRHILGNGRIISVRPVRGGPTLLGGKLWFTTGVWPFEGTFLHSMDVTGPSDAPGRIVTTNLSDVAPQGSLAAFGDRIVVPLGRDNAIVFHPETRARRSLRYSAKGRTDYFAATHGTWTFHGDKIIDDVRGGELPVSLRRPVVEGSYAWGVDRGDLVAYDLSTVRDVETKDRKGKTVRKAVLDAAWRLPNEAVAYTKEIAELRKQGTEKEPNLAYYRWLVQHPIAIALKTKQRLWGHQDRTLFALELGDDLRAAPRVDWHHELDAAPSSVVAAGGRLYVATRAGEIACFGADAPAEIRVTDARAATKDGDAETAPSGFDGLAAYEGRAGYCVVLGAEPRAVFESVLARTNLELIVVEPNTGRAASAREQLADAGHLGERATVVSGAAALGRLPPYLADLVVGSSQGFAPDIAPDIAQSGASRFAEEVFRVLRPYGGVARLTLSETRRFDIRDWAEQRQAPDVKFETLASTIQDDGVGTVTLERVGALPGSANWEREYGDEGNTLTSRDSLVKAPLGLLWYGGPAGSSELFYNRHNWPPGMAVVDGRMYIQGPGRMAAIDVYTGRVVWDREIRYGGGGVEQRMNLTSVSGDRMGNPLFGIPPAGFNFLVAGDAIYLVYPEVCIVYDRETGKEQRELKLPIPGEWGRVREAGGKFIVSVLEPREAEGKKQRLPFALIALDPKTGTELWRYDAANALPFVAVGRGRVYCFDAHLEKLYQDKRRGNDVPKATSDKVFRCLDLDTGNERWSLESDMVAAWVSYSADHDVLIASNSSEVRGFHGTNGYELWKQDRKATGFKGHPENLVHKVILWHDRVIDQRGPGLSYDLLTGKSITKKDPLTGREVPWEFTKVGHHCNYAIASEHLLTFRAGEAGFCDLESGETSRLLGFRSGCRNSLIPANGVLNAPNFAHGCICSYSIYTSLGLVHVPDNEQWSYSAHGNPTAAVERVGVNLGAPGDRVSPNGTLWLDWPNVGGPSPSVGVSSAPEKPRSFHLHSSEVDGAALRWVTSSGLEGVETIRLALAPKPKKPEDEANEPPASAVAEDGSLTYTVLLYFLEPHDVASGARVFDVAIEAHTVLEALDVAREAGGSRVGIVREFRAESDDGTLEIELRAREGKTLLSGIEIVRE